MKTKKKIGWQKYEDVLESQLSSPLFKDLMNNLVDSFKSDDSEEQEEYFTEEEAHAEPMSVILPVPNDMASEISLVATFDCWIGHTNFDITPSVKRALNEVNGVEVLKICSRYRFFIGVGKMFEFKTVREDIEKIIKDKENNGNEREN